MPVGSRNSSDAPMMAERNQTTRKLKIGGLFSANWRSDLSATGRPFYGLPRDAPPRDATQHRKSALELMLMASRPRTIDNVNQMVMRKHNQLDEQEMLVAIKEALSK
jgi:hypothetical protein